MLTASLTYNAYPDERWSDMRVTFRVVDTDAAALAVSSSNDTASVAQLAQTHDGIETLSGKYATLEAGGWVLDGTCSLFSASVTALQTGYWSSISQLDRTFSANPTLSHAWTSNHTSFGFTLLFDDIADWYPEALTITAYDSANVTIDSQTASIASCCQVIDMPVTDYYKVTAEFTKTKTPYQRIRLAEEIFGYIQIFNRDNIVMGSILYEITPDSSSLPTSEMIIEIDNSDKRFNPINPNGVFSYLAQSQPMDVSIGVGSSSETLEYINMGRFYYTKTEPSSNYLTTKIIAHDLLHNMDKTTYKKGATGNETVASLISAVVTDSGTGLEAIVSTAVSTVVISSALPLVSHREAIRMIAQAARSNVFINRDNKLELAELTVGTAQDTLDTNNMYDYPKITFAEPTNKVEVSVITRGISDTVPTTKILYDSTLDINGTENTWVTYANIGYNIAVYSSSGTINTSLSTFYLNGADLNITGTGNVTVKLSGYALSEYDFPFTLDNVGTGETEQLLKIQNNLINTNALASAVATWAYNVANKRIAYTIQERGNPAREVGDTATIYDSFGENDNALIVKQQFNFDGTLSADTKGWN
jgi:hypothetical protein